MQRIYSSVKTFSHTEISVVQYKFKVTAALIKICLILYTQWPTFIALCFF